MLKLNRWLVAASLILPFTAFAAGAIAVDDEEGESDPGYGVVTGYASRDEAGASALAECRKQGNKNCKVAVRFDKCGAYASSKKNSGIGFGGTVAAARTKALEECGGGACKIIVAECE